MAYANSNILFDALKNILQTKSDELFQKHVEAEAFSEKHQKMMDTQLTR